MIAQLINKSGHNSQMLAKADTGVKIFAARGYLFVSEGKVGSDTSLDCGFYLPAIASLELTQARRFKNTV